ncbi:MAG: helix-turn-helix domain-containing protein, partial [Flavonifractor plautii]
MFEERLYQLRRERGISQEELANIIGVSRQAVQKWESGASQPNMDNLVAISAYFGVTLDYLLKGDEPGWD